jgi:hypothetical protein
MSMTRRDAADPVEDRPDLIGFLLVPDFPMFAFSAAIEPLRKLLAERGADPKIWNQPNKLSVTPLFSAEGYGHRLPRPVGSARRSPRRRNFSAFRK